jgi:hypothetical protein
MEPKKTAKVNVKAMSENILQSLALAMPSTLTLGLGKKVSGCVASLVKNTTVSLVLQRPLEKRRPSIAELKADAERFGFTRFLSYSERSAMMRM